MPSPLRLIGWIWPPGPASARPVLENGQEVRAYLRAVDEEGGPATPTGLSFELRRPDGSVQVLEGGAIQAGEREGEVFAAFQADQNGLWRWQWIGTGPTEARDGGAFRVQSSTVRPPDPGAPVLATEDLDPLATAGGGLLRVKRITALPAAVTAAGMSLAGAQDGEARRLDADLLMQEATQNATSAAQAAAPKTSPADLAGGPLFADQAWALLVRNEGSVVPYRKLPAAPATPIDGVHIQRTDGSGAWWEAAIGPDVLISDINGTMGSALGAFPPSSQNDMPRIAALLNHVHSKYGTAAVRLPPRMYQALTKATLPVRANLMGATRPGFEGYDNPDGREIITGAPCIVVDPSVNGIEIGANTTITDINFIRRGHVYPSSWSTLMAVSAAFAGTAIDMVRSGIPNRARNVTIERCGFYGFLYGIDANIANRAVFRQLRLDCTNGIRLTSGGDGVLIEYTRQFNWLNSGSGTDSNVVTVGITGWFDAGGRLGANLDTPADGLFSGMRIGADRAPLDGFGRVTVDVLSPTQIAFRDIPFSPDYDYDPDADISYRKQGASVLSAISNEGGLTKISTEVPFPWLLAGQKGYLRVGFPTIGHPLEAGHVFTAVLSPNEIVLPVPWDPSYATIPLANTDFALLPGDRGGTTLYATGVDGLSVRQFFSKGNARAAYLSGGNIYITAGGSEGPITGEESFYLPGSMGLEIASVGRFWMDGAAWKHADIAVRLACSGTTESEIAGCQIGGPLYAIDLIRGRLLMVGNKSPDAATRRINAAAAVKELQLVGGQFRRADVVGAVDRRRIVDWTERASNQGEARLVVPGWRLATVGIGGTETDRIVVGTDGSVAINGTDLATLAPVRLVATTTDGTPVRLTRDGLAATAANIGPTVENASGRRARPLRIRAKAERTAGSGTEDSSASWELDVFLTRRLNVNTTELRGGDPDLEPTSADGAGGAWRLSVTADTVLGGMDIRGTTGTPGVTVSWTVNVEDV